MIEKIKKYFRGVNEQAKMVRWPKKADLLKSVSVVLVVMLISAAALTLSDFVVGKLLQALESQTKSSARIITLFIDSFKCFF